MITMTLVNIFLCISLNLFASNRDTDWSALSKVQIQEYQQLEQATGRSRDIKHLRQAKDYLINGNTKMARFHLEQIDLKNSPVRLIRNRYLSILEFVEGNYDRSLNLIESYTFNSKKYYKEICSLRLINMMALHTMDQDYLENKKVDKELLNEFNNCAAQTSVYSKSDHYWLETMTRFKIRDKEFLQGSEVQNVQFVKADLDLTRIWLKSGIYLNKEAQLKKYIASLPPETYKSNTVRELLGLMYYRLGEFDKAAEFVEGITSPNAENIKGNLRLRKNELELAFGHFKVALLKKENSINALERAIPLAWILGQWEEGIRLLGSFIKPEQDQRKKMALDTAFKIKIEDYKDAEKQISILKKLFKRSIPQEVELMNSYISLRRKNTKVLAESSSTACKRFDGINCWIQMQMNTWINLGKTIERNEPIMSEDELDIDSLKLTAEISPLDEAIIIDQKDIEELDSKSIKIDLKTL